MSKHAGRPRYRFKPWNVGRWVLWGLFALVLLLAPLVWKSSFAHTMLSQMGIAIIAMTLPTPHLRRLALRGAP